MFKLIECQSFHVDIFNSEELLKNSVKFFEPVRKKQPVMKSRSSPDSVRNPYIIRHKFTRSVLKRFFAF